MGRAGWCPGFVVQPIFLDLPFKTIHNLLKDANPGAKTGTDGALTRALAVILRVRYEGLFGGKVFAPEEQMMHAELHDDTG